jgi:glycerol uptake facilitator protein
MSPFTAELIGTMLMILLGNGVVANVVLTGTKGNSGGWIVIATAWGLAVFAAVAVAGPYSGAQLNPAVTIGLALARKISWSIVLPNISAQFLGAFIGQTLVWLMYYDHYEKTTDAGAILATFSTGPALRNYGLNLISEIIGTFVLIFVVFYFTGAELGPEKTPVGLGTLGALPVTFLVWGIGLSLGGTTGYAINPARDLGPRIIHAILPIKNKKSSDWGYAWVPVLGPLIGALLAAYVYFQIR